MMNDSLSIDKKHNRDRRHGRLLSSSRGSAIGGRKPLGPKNDMLNTDSNAASNIKGTRSSIRSKNNILMKEKSIMSSSLRRSNDTMKRKPAVSTIVSCSSKVDQKNKQSESSSVSSSASSKIETTLSRIHERLQKMSEDAKTTSAEKKQSSSRTMNNSNIENEELNNNGVKSVSFETPVMAVGEDRKVMTNVDPSTPLSANGCSSVVADLTHFFSSDILNENAVLNTPPLQQQSLTKLVEPIWSISPPKALDMSDERDDSPTKNKTEDDLPTLSLGSFQETLWLDFGDEQSNLVGETKSLDVRIHAPTDKCTFNKYSVKVEKVPHKTGFSLNLNNNFDDEEKNETMVVVEKGQSKVITIQWTPNKPGRVREIIQFKLNRGRLTITVHGAARGLSSSNTKKKKRVAKTSSSTTGTARQMKEKPVLSSSGQLSSTTSSTRAKTITKNKPSPPQPPPPVSRPNKNNTTLQRNKARATNLSNTSLSEKKQATNSNATTIIFDENWANKQCDNFTNWINYLFQPSEEEASQESENAGSTSPFSAAAQKVDHATFRTLLLHRRWSQYRNKADALFKSEEMVTIRKTLKKQINESRLSIRTDRDVISDINLRSFMVDLFFSYNISWLKLALETMLDQNISHPFSTKNSTSSSIKSTIPSTRPTSSSSRNQNNFKLKPKMSKTAFALKSYIIECILADPEVTMKYTGGRCKVLSGNFDKKYRSEMRKKALHKILVLVILLDRLKTANVFSTNPPLFCSGAKLKSSNDIIISICRECLSGEGNIIKHLSRSGIQLSYIQRPIDNYEFFVTNLAVDLRDGVRLTRLIEILTEDHEFSLSKKMRLPAVSRLQKLHNVEVSLAALEDAAAATSGKGGMNSSYSVTADIAPSHVVDGHRKKVLKLLWSIISHFKLSSLLDPYILQKEIDDIQRRNNKCENTTASIHKEEVKERCVDGCQNVTALLLQWCQTICRQFGLKVENFTTSFADGKALCYLVRHYHPRIIRESDILPTTNDFPHLFKNKSPSDLLEDERYCQYLENERSNSALANSKMTELGGIPSMIPVGTSSIDTPEEKSMITCLAYLCSRLIDCRKEIKACKKLQAFFRFYLFQKLNKRKMVAASIIFNHWIEKKGSQNNQKSKNMIMMEENKAAFCIQTFWKNCVERNDQKARQRIEIVNDTSATQIQRHIRGVQARVNLQLQQHSAGVIQRVWRGKTIHQDFMAKKHAIILVQKQIRAYISRKQYLKLVDSCIKILSLLRYYLDRKRYLDLRQNMRRNSELAAIEIQRHVRGMIVRDNTELSHFAASEIQRVWRGVIPRFDFLEVKYSTVLLQRQVRRYIARNQYINTMESIVKIQSMMRCYIDQRRYLNFKQIMRYEWAATEIQKHARGMICREYIQIKYFAALEIQRIWRGFVPHYDLMLMKYSATNVQKQVRGYIARNQYAQTIQSIIKVQSVGRSYLDRKRYTIMKEHMMNEWAATEIQRYARGMTARMELRIQDFAAGKIQRVWRGVIPRYEFLVMKHCAITLQAQLRGYIAKNQYAQTVQSIIKVQSVGRSYLDRKRYTIMKEHMMNEWAATEIQRYVRGMTARMELRVQDFAAGEIQRVWRGVIPRYEFLVMKHCAITLQAQLRGYIARNQYAQTVQSIIKVQSVGRSYLDRKKYTIMKEHMMNEWAATEIQRYVRGMTARYELRVQDFAAGEIQRVWRGVIPRYEFLVMKHCAITLQAQLRGYIARNQYAQTVQSIIKVQSVGRSYLDRKKYNIMKEHIMNEWAATEIQRVFRGAAARYELRVQDFAAGEIQRVWRGVIPRYDFIFLRYSTIVAQKQMRGYIARKRYMATIDSIVKIQAAVRCHFEAKKCLDLRIYIRNNQAATDIQRVFRGAAARYELRVQDFAASEIQRTWRGFIQRYDFIILKFAAIIVQKQVRGCVARKQYIDSIESIVKIQSMVRRYQNLKRYLRKRQMVIMKNEESKHNAASVIQYAVRGYLWLKKILNKIVTVQSVVRGYLQRLQYQRLKRATLSLQSIYRGHKVRQSRSLEERKLAVKVAKANTNARENPDMIIGVRTDYALRVLQKSSRLAMIMKATMMLEVSTRLSPNCCVSFIDARAPDILFNLVRTCNRSLPHVELVQHVLMTLLNVSKHTSLIPSLSSSSRVDILLDLIQMFRDKEIVFSMAAKLLGIMCESSDKYLIKCISRENTKRLKGIIALSTRQGNVSKKVNGSRNKNNSSSEGSTMEGVAILKKILRKASQLVG